MIGQILAVTEPNVYVKNMF